MKDLIIDQFQTSVDEILIRHASLLDIITKFSESSSRVNRSVAKTVTSCGCMHLCHPTSAFKENTDYDQLKESGKRDMTGSLCPTCREKVEEEIGAHMFYLAALCNKTDINIYDVFLKEYDRIKTLGKYNLY